MASASKRSEHTQRTASAASLYTPLDPEKDDIRILDIQPGEEGQVLRCTLRSVSLLDNPWYHALSYVWGDPNIRAPIMVNGQEFQAAISLVAALKALRAKNMPTIWADAICINQDDLAERGSQVDLMRTIYQRAHGVQIWLGYITENWWNELPEDDFKSGEARRFMLEAERGSQIMLSEADPSRNFNGPGVYRTHEQQRVDTDLSKISMVVRCVREAVQENSLMKLPFYRTWREDRDDRLKFEFDPEWFVAVGILRWAISRPWWQRAWTLQECVVPAKVPVVHIGDFHISLSDFFGSNANILRLSSTTNPNRQMLWNLCFGSWNPHHRVSAVRLTVHGFHIPGASYDFSSIMVHMITRKASDLRDLFYSAIGLVKSLPVIHVDYTIDFTEVCCRATKAMLIGSDLLDTWIYHTVGINQDGRSTWALDFTPQHGRTLAVKRREDRIDKSAIFDQFEGPSLILKARKLAVVEGARHPRPFENQLDSREGRQALGKGMQEGIRQCQKLCALCDVVDEPNILWRTLALDTKTTSVLEPLTDENVAEYRRCYEELLLYDVNPSQKDLALLRHLSESLKEWAFFCSQDGKPGMGPASMHFGDNVYVLQGCDIPVVLRPLRAATQSEGDCFNLVGYCYFHGWMQGEACAIETDWEMITLK